MEIKEYTRRDIKQLTKTKPISGTFNIFPNGTGIIKIYKDPMFDLMKFGCVVYPNGLVNIEQIESLAGKQFKIHQSKMPNGIVYFENYPIGVMYPVYFKNYLDFNTINSKELSEMIIKFRMATDKNIELLENGIYNADFTMKNILYNDIDVQLIDLEGKYIYEKLPYPCVYSYFVFGMMKQIYDKISSTLSEKDSIEVISEIERRIELLNKKEISIEYPHQVLDEVEKSKILTLN